MSVIDNETTRTSSFDCDHNPQGSHPEQNINTIEPNGAALIQEIGYPAFRKLQDSTTEVRLRDVRAGMTDYKPHQTFRREHGRINGYYFTEPVDNRRV